MRATLGIEGDRLGQFRSPCGMAVDSKHIYIADTLNHRIQVFDMQSHNVLGQVTIPGVSNLGQLSDPSGLCCSGDMRLIVAEYGLDRLLTIQLSPDSLKWSA